jgi:L-lactate dehydrogenase
VGTAIAYACLIRGSARELALYDVNAKKVRAEVLDLNHGSPSFRRAGSPVATTSRSPLSRRSSSSRRAPSSTRARADWTWRQRTSRWPES